MTGYEGQNCMNCSADLGTSENQSTFYTLNCNSRVSSSLFPDTSELVPVPRAVATIFNFEALERLSQVNDVNKLNNTLNVENDSPLKDFESSATSVPICFVCYMVLSDLYRTYTEFSQLRKANSFLGSKLLHLENYFKSQSRNHRSEVNVIATSTRDEDEMPIKLKGKLNRESPPCPLDFVKVEGSDESDPEPDPEAEYDVEDTGGVTEDEEQGGQVEHDDELLSFTSSMGQLPSTKNPSLNWSLPNSQIQSQNKRYIVSTGNMNEPFTGFTPFSVTPNKKGRYETQKNSYTASSSKQPQHHRNTTGTRKGSKSRISNFQFTIPAFNDVIMRGLTGDGTVESVWNKVVDVVARELLPLNIGNKNDYAIVGETLVARFERLGKQSSGKQPPWTQLMRCISTKLRNIRKTAKLANLLTEIDSQVIRGPLETVCDQTFHRKSLSRDLKETEDSQLIVADEAINLLSAEIAKGEQRSESIILDCWEKAFISRTNAIKQRISPLTIIKQHPLLLNPAYLVTEAKLLLGEEAHLKLERNICKFLPAIIEHENTQWAVSALKEFQSSFKDQCMLILFFEETAEFEQYVLSSTFDSPQLLVQIKENTAGFDESIICSSSIHLFGVVISDVASLEDGIKLLILLYLVLDLEVPQRFQKFLFFLQTFSFGFSPIGIGMSQQNKMVLLKLLSIILNKEARLP